MAGKRSSFLKNVFTVRIVSENSQKSILFKFKPMHVILLIIALTCVGFYYFSNKKNDNSELVALNSRYEQSIKANRELTLHIDKLREERNRLAGLVEMQNIELADRLEDIEKTDSEVRSIIGLPKKEKESDNSKKINRQRHSSLSSRSKLASSYVKMNSSPLFSEIKSEIEEKGKNIESLRTPAIKHMQAIERRRRLESLVPCGMPTEGYISSSFGYRYHPIMGYSRFHSGVDIAAYEGRGIHAAASGRVVDCGYMSGYGNCVILSHGYGLKTLYGHCRSINVNLGQHVNKGDVIAFVGSTGMSTGPHLHYEVIENGVQIDPVPFFDYSKQRIDRLISKYGIR